MVNEHVETTPMWVGGSALAAPAILGAATGLLVGDLVGPNARRGFGLGLGILGVLAVMPYAIEGVAALVTGPRSKFGVRRKIQKIRDFGIVAPGVDAEQSVESLLRQQGIV